MRCQSMRSESRLSHQYGLATKMPLQPRYWSKHSSLGYIAMLGEVMPISASLIAHWLGYGTERKMQD